MICPLSPAHLVGLTAFELSLFFLFYDAALAPLPLIAFVLSCLLAPFVPRLRYFLPIVRKGRTGERAVAVTFDGGPDPLVTPPLLELLGRHAAPAAFFVTGTNVERCPGIVRDILSHGHSVGTHSRAMMPFLMLSGTSTLRRELESTRRALRPFGILPLAFRPPASLTNPRLWRILLEHGMYCVGFSRRARDLGNRRTLGLASRILGKVAPGDIIALHDIAPRDGNVGHLLEEFDTLIRGLRGRGLEIVPLDRLIGRDVMRGGEWGSVPHPAALFYDGLADAYDEEQFRSAVSISKIRERALFSARLPDLFAGADRVLEIGAGTGIFTLDIARRCREVLAVDISGRMLGILERKARREGLDNIRTMTGNVESMEFAGTFSVVCAFSSLEYLVDLPALFRRVAPHVAPGGALYFITARRSLFRLATQVGNAMRQGIWLKARSRKEIEAMLSAAGFEDIGITSHLLKSWVSGGMLLEVAARKPPRTRCLMRDPR